MANKEYKANTGKKNKKDLRELEDLVEKKERLHTNKEISVIYPVEEKEVKNCEEKAI